MIVAPTRELAIQIKDESRKFCNGSMIRSVVAYGGTSTGFQLTQLFKGVFQIWLYVRVVYVVGKVKKKTDLVSP